MLNYLSTLYWQKNSDEFYSISCVRAKRSESFSIFRLRKLFGRQWQSNTFEVNQFRSGISQKANNLILRQPEHRKKARFLGFFSIYIVTSDSGQNEMFCKLCVCFQVRFALRRAVRSFSNFRRVLLRRELGVQQNSAKTKQISLTGITCRISSEWEISYCQCH